jgi:hypothetical protein
VTFLVIQLTSSVTLKVLGTARNAGLVVFSFLFLGEVVTWLQGVGYMLSLVAFGFYNYFKMQKPAVVVAPLPADETVCDIAAIRIMCHSDIVAAKSGGPP